MPGPEQYRIYRILASSFVVVLAVLLTLSRTKSLRANPASRTYTIFIMATIGYLISNVLEISTRSEAGNLFFSRFVYLFIPFVPFLWLDFSIRLGKAGRGISLPGAIAVLFMPVLTIVFVFSDRLMPLIWKRIEFFVIDGFVISRRSHGLWWYIFAAYTYLTVLAGFIVAIRAFALSRRYYRKRYLWLLVSFLVPAATNLVFIFRPVPGLVKDFTPISYAVGGICFFVALYRLDSFSVVPFARDFIVERMSAGVLVFDGDLRVLDANAAALRALNAGENLIGGRALAGESSENRPSLVSVFEGAGENLVDLPAELLAAVAQGRKGVFERRDESGVRRYAVEPVAIEPRSGLARKGTLVVIHDETEIRDLLAQVEGLARKDPLTGLSNRRGFMEAAEARFSSALRYGEPISVAMFDLDRFKLLNDEHGHAAGDRALQGFAGVLVEDLRGSDVAGRIGGEEFALVLPRTDAAGALVVCERIRRDYAALRFRDDRGLEYRGTVSVGIASVPEATGSLEGLLESADRSLYRAKGEGRDRVVCGDSND